MADTVSEAPTAPLFQYRVASLQDPLPLSGGSVTKNDWYMLLWAKRELALHAVILGEGKHPTCLLF